MGKTRPDTDLSVGMQTAPGRQIHGHPVIQREQYDLVGRNVLGGRNGYTPNTRIAIVRITVRRQGGCNVMLRYFDRMKLRPTNQRRVVDAS